MNENSRIPLEKIKSKEEYNQHKLNWEYCMKEEQWLATTENPIKSVSDQLRTLLQQLENTERNSNQEMAILKDIHVLGVKLGMLSDGSYHSVLMENEKVETILLNEYEKEHQMSKGQYFKEILSGKEDARELLEYQILKLSGTVVMPTSLESIPKSKIYIDFVELYKDSFVDIDIEEVKEQVKEQLALVPADDIAKGIIAKAEKDLLARVETEREEVIKGATIEVQNNGKGQGRKAKEEKSKGKEPERNEFADRDGEIEK